MEWRSDTARDVATPREIKPESVLPLQEIDTHHVECHSIDR